MNESTHSMRFEDEEEGELLKVGVPLMSRSSSAASVDTLVTDGRSMSLTSNNENELKEFEA